MMKKRLLCLLLLAVLVLSTGASAANTPTEAAKEEIPEEDIVRVAPGTHGYTIPLKYTDRYLNILMNDLSQFPFEYIFAIIEKDPIHLTYSFYTSMGCEDITCTDPDHVHWCPMGICQDPAHGHSAAEYNEIVKWDPQCSCHRR